MMQRYPVPIGVMRSNMMPIQTPQFSGATFFPNSQGQAPEQVQGQTQNQAQGQVNSS